MIQPHRFPIRSAAVVLAVVQGLAEFVTLQRWRLRAWAAR